MASHSASRTSRLRAILFRIFYSTSFTVVFLLSATFACAGPIDALYQSYHRGRYIDIFLIAGSYVLTGLIAIFLYASRLYTNRSILRDIPKTYMPIDKGELGNKRVWRFIEDCKSRSDVIAYLARPRTRRIENEVSYARERIDLLLQPEHSKEYRIFEPQWGTIDHPGWTGPAAKETPNLEYGSVVTELINLVEARAVSLAPVGEASTIASAEATAEATADAYVIEALRRPEEAGMRQYIYQLVSLDVLDDTSLVIAFLTLYERARFAPEPLKETEFRSLMRMFAEILRAMRTLDTSRLDMQASDVDADDAILPDDPTALSLRQTPHNIGAMPSTSSLADASTSSASVAGSVRHHRPTGTARTTPFAASLALPTTTTNTTPLPPPRISHDSVCSLSSAASSAYHDAAGDTTWTEPTSRPPFFRARPTSRGLGRGERRARSGNGTAQERKSRRSRIRRAVTSRPSFESARTGGGSLKSGRSTMNASVIRLNPEYDGSREQVPFEYVHAVPRDGEDSH